jgi:hypothetical protein
LASGRISPLLAFESRTLDGRLQIETQLRAVIWRMTVENRFMHLRRVLKPYADYDNSVRSIDP